MCVLATQFPVSNHDIIHKMTAVISTQLSRHNFFCFSQQKIFSVCFFFYHLYFIKFHYLFTSELWSGSAHPNMAACNKIYYSKTHYTFVDCFPSVKQSNHKSFGRWFCLFWLDGGRPRERERDREYISGMNILSVIVLFENSTDQRRGEPLNQLTEERE